MGRKLDALFGRKSKASKLKLTLNLAISRLSILNKHRHARLSVARSDVVHLLNLNQHQQALLRVDQVFKDQNMLDVYVMAESYCRMLIQSLTLIQQHTVCPDELQEAASSLLYAAPRCGEFPELQEIRAILTAHFGKEFASAAIELRDNCRVSQKMIQKLSSKQPNLDSRMKMLREIAAENGIVLQLNEPSTAVKKEKLEVRQKQNQPEAEDYYTVLPKEVGQVLNFSNSMKGRKNYRDAADAAQDAFESAAYAAAAARAAVQLSRLESFDSGDQDSPNSQPRKVLSSGSIKSKLGDSKGSSQMGLEKTHWTPEYDSESEVIYEEIDFDNGYSDEQNTRPGHRNFESRFGEGSKMQSVLQLDLERRPISMRVKRVYER